MYPNFLCIGALKAGTTWLDLNLRNHPNIKMTPVKEIHYFDDPSTMPTITRVITENWWRILLKHPLQRSLKERRKGYLQWLLRFLFLPRNENWYASLFSPGVGQISGETTPSYASLNENIVARIQDLMPNLKIIYILRNPIHRTWSHAAMYFRDLGYKNLETVSEEDIIKFLELETVTINSDYLKTLQTWEKFYPENQFFVGFFDQLVQDPRDFIKEIYDFLELDKSDPFIPDTVYKKRNTRPYPEIPIRFSSYLAHKYYNQIKQLHTRFANSYTSDWLYYAEQWL
jgi:hypothetical protein